MTPPPTPTPAPELPSSLTSAKSGRKGLLVPIVGGIVVLLLLLAVAFHFRKKPVEIVAAAPAVVLEPAKHRRSLDRFEDKELGYSFDMPSGYEAVPAEKKPKLFRHVFLKRGVGESHAVITIKEMAKPIVANSHLQQKDLPAETNLVPFLWRGLSVDGLRVVEETKTEDYVTFSIQIPLKGHGLLIGFGGPGSNEAILKAQAEQTLATLDGEVNQ